MLFELLEEYLDHPALLIEHRDGACRPNEVVGDEFQRLSRIGIFEPDHAKRFSIFFRRLLSRKLHGKVVGDILHVWGYFARFEDSIGGGCLGASDEKHAAAVQIKEQAVVEVAAVHQ